MKNATLYITESGVEVKLSNVLLQGLNYKDDVVKTARELSLYKKHLDQLLESYDTGKISEGLVRKYSHFVEKYINTFPDEQVKIIRKVLDLIEDNQLSEIEAIKPKKVLRKYSLKYPVVVIGHQCAGKTTLIKELKKRGLKPAKLETDRPKRGRGDNSHKFVDVFDKDKYVIQKSYQIDKDTVFNYGLTEKVVKSSNVFDINPSQVIELLEYHRKAIVIHLNPPESVLRERYAKNDDRGYDDFDRRFTAFEKDELPKLDDVDELKYIKIVSENVEDALKKLFFYSR